MKVLFDVNVPKGIGHRLPHHEIVTAQELGWGEASNRDESFVGRTTSTIFRPFILGIRDRLG